METAHIENYAPHPLRSVKIVTAMPWTQLKRSWKQGDDSMDAIHKYADEIEGKIP